MKHIAPALDSCMCSICQTWRKKNRETQARLDHAEKVLRWYAFKSDWNRGVAGETARAYFRAYDELARSGGDG